MTPAIQVSKLASQKGSFKSLLSRDSVRLRRIIVPIDLTSDTAKAIDMAVGLAKRFGADLFLVHVYAEPCSFAYARGPNAYVECEQQLSLAKSRLVAARDRTRKEYSRCFAIFRQSVDLQEEILVVAKEIKADLIVVPAHHRNWLERLGEGSQAERIVRKSPCPILVVHEEGLQAA
jgi:universal stress protein A